MRGFTALLAAFAAVLVFAGASPATSAVAGERLAFDAIKHAPIAGSEKTVARTEIERAVHLVRVLPSGRREHVAVALEELAAFDHRLTLPRTLILIGQLKANDDYFSKHYAPADKTDITDDDGLVYRYFAGRCLEFHPLANFGALNAHVAASDEDATRTMADALIARGVYQTGGGIGFEYEFSYGGQAPWLSGMAQAVAAQAFSRAAQLVPDRSTAYMRTAQASYRLIPRKLLTRVAAGPWIKLYAFSSLPVLNAQLQAVLSLEAYAGNAEDSSAAALASRMKTSAAEMLGRFDTGYWTYYSLDGTPSPLDYQQFVVALLKKLSPQDTRFASASTRIAAYQKQPPAFMVANGGLGSLRFWLSKPARVHVVSGAGPAKWLTLNGGWHTLAWGEPKNPGTYGVQLHATDWAGNSASFDALPIVRVTAKKASAARAVSSGPAGPTFVLGTRVLATWPAAATVADPTLVAQLQAVSSPSLELTVAPGADPAALTA
ncbi:MAG TPA: D-glucuronyl C5-epimerase family protein, partial [Gaiellaceae bacterium]|nr:D-glucuronyl C5-epimerase family protein [Gaiellaceae bacterium]